MQYIEHVFMWTATGGLIAPLSLLLAGGTLMLLALASLLITLWPGKQRLARPAGRTLAGASGALFTGSRMGLGTGIAGGIAFLFLQSRLGEFFFAPPDTLTQGFILGTGLGTLLMLTVSLFWTANRWLMAGLLIGTLVLLGGFRFGYGITAGYGPAVGVGVGPEVAMVYGMAGGLGGMLIASLVQMPQHLRLTVRWAAGGLLAGFMAGVATAVFGWMSGNAIFMTPYVATMGPTFTTPTTGQTLDGAIYGVSVFAAAGVLIGALAGRLSVAPRTPAEGDWHARLNGMLSALGLLAGLAGGMGIALMPRLFGGPLSMSHPISDPAAGLAGLFTGLAAGVLAAAGAWFVWHRLRPHATATVADRAVWCLALIIAGIGIITLPHSYISLFALSIH